MMKTSLGLEIPVSRVPRSLRFFASTVVCAILPLAAWAQSIGVTTLAGSAGNTGYVDATGSSARFSSPTGVAVDSAGNTYVADANNHRIRKVTSAGVVTTLAGSGSAGSADATGTLASFNTPRGVALDASATNLYVADTLSNKIRKIVISTGVVSTVAGSGSSGFADNAVGTSATFNQPWGLVVESGGANLYVADTENNVIRRIALSGTNTVATIAGTAPNAGISDGVGVLASFNKPRGIAANGTNLFVADTSNFSIRSIVISGATVTTLAGLNGVAGYQDATGSLARFTQPGAVVVSGANLLVADTGTQTIRQVVIGSAAVTTIAGTPYTAGNADGAGEFARFQLPAGIGVDGSGNVFIADTGNQTIRRSGAPSSISISSPSSATFAVSTLGTFTVTAVASPTITAFTTTGSFPGWASLTTNIGANTATLSGTPGPLDVASSPYSFTINATNGFSSTSQAFTLTVSAGAAINVQPVNAAVATGQNAQFSVSASGTPTPTYQWSRQPAAGGGFTNLTEAYPYSGVTSSTLSVASVTAGMSGDQFQVVVTNGIGSPVTSNSATLTVAAPPVITSPSSANFAVGVSGSFTITATGAPVPIFAYSGSFPSWASLNTVTGAITGTPPDQTGSPFFFTITAANTVNPQATQFFTLSVNPVGPIPTFTTTPANITVQSGLSAQFTGVAVANPAPTLRWQRQLSGSFLGFQDLSDDFTYSGTSSNTLTINVATAAMNGDQFRLVATNQNGAIPSNAATLSVTSNPPTILVNPTSVFANGGQSTTFFANATGVPTPALRWQRQPSGIIGYVNLTDDGIYSGTNSATLTILSVTGGMNGDSFRMVATNAGGTSQTSSATLTVNLGTTISTLAGLAGASGSVDGSGANARFNGLASIVVDASGMFYIADTANHVIRQMTPGGDVTTIAGLAGNSGNLDGVGNAARFNAPAGIAVDNFGNIYVADTFNHTIRRISAGVVTTIAGSPGSIGAVDGIGNTARFFLPTGLAVDNAGSIFVADSQNHAIRRVTNQGLVATFAGQLGAPGFVDNALSSLARFNLPNSLVRDSNGNFYVADSQNNAIRKITPSGSVSTLAGNVGAVPGSTDGIGSLASFFRPSGVAVDTAGVVFVADTNNHTIRRISVNAEVTTLAGFPLQFGSTDGVGGSARFNRPFSVVVDSNNNLYVADTGNHTVRRSGTTTAPSIITHPANATAGIGQDATFTVAAGGVPVPSSYQWQRQGPNDIDFASLVADSTYTGVNTATLTVRAVAATMNNDRFRVVVSNGVLPSATSNSATLTAGVLPVFTSPVAASFRAMEANSFAVKATSPTPVVYTATGLPSWATLNSSTGVLAGIPPDTTGTPFTIMLSASNGVVATQAFTLTVLPANLPPVIAQQPVGASVNPGQTASFNVAATGTAPFTYQWRRNGIAVAGATGTSLTLNGVQASSAGTYTAVVTNAFGTATSAGANLVVNVAPYLSQQPSSQIAAAGSSVTFNVVATGGSNYTYQWRRNGLAIPGAHAASFTMGNIGSGDAGNYDVVVANSAGSTTSSVALLTIATVPSAPLITLQPASRAALAGTSVTLAVSATGVPAPGYQWRKNGTAIAGANGTTYSLSVAAETAAYDVIVANASGIVTSSSAVVRGFPVSYAGIYFGSFSGGLGNFALFVRPDNTGVFLGYLPGSTAPVMNLALTLANTGQFAFTQGAIASTANEGEPARAAALGAVTLIGAIGSDGAVSGSLSGGANASLSGTRAVDTGATQNVAGYYLAGAGNSAATAYTIASSAGQAMVVVQAGSIVDGGSGTVSNAGQVSVITTRSVISETINAVAGTITGTSTGAVAATFAGGSDAAVALQRLVNISSRARVGTLDSVAIAGFVISGEESKTVLIRAVGPTLGSAPFNVSGALAAPRLELFRGSISIATNSGIASNRTAIDAAGQQAGAFALGSAGSDAALLTTLAPGNYTAVVSSTTNATGVALIEVYDLSGGSLGQKLLNISTRAAVGTDDNLLIAGFVIPSGTTKRVLIRGVGPGLTAFGVPGALARPVLTLFSGSTSVASNTNWTTSVDATAITAASSQVGAFGLSNNDSAMIATLAPGNYTAQVVGVGGTVGIALLEVYELP